jgi:hypothetical protein
MLFRCLFRCRYSVTGPQATIYTNLVTVNESSEIKQFSFTIATNFRALTRCMDVSVGHERFLFIYLYLIFIYLFVSVCSVYFESSNDVVNALPGNSSIHAHNSRTTVSCNPFLGNGSVNTFPLTEECYA